MRSRGALEEVGLVLSILLGVLLTYYLVRADVVSLTYGNIPLANLYLRTVPDPSSPFTSRSPEVVTSVIWDQRGYDTYFETSVLFIAIIGVLYLAGLGGGRGNSSVSTVIPRVIAKILFPVIVAVSVSVALHGHLTPGGGFQGGSIFAVAPFLYLLVFGRRMLEGKGFRANALLFARSLAVFLITVVGSIVLVVGLLTGVPAFLFQNQPKPQLSPIGYPAYVVLPWGGIFLFSGTLMILNVLEFTAVSTGFTLALVIIDTVTGGRE
ncbi:MnhB domain-containing protein [Thermogladius sp.]|uniref:MnhB domain-containing protein n=1 Tax=Thermogladius sp. TaxID=2023064 RepID=UPI003D09B1D8